MTLQTQKLPRCERKKIRLAQFVAAQEKRAAERAEYLRTHKISAGLIPVVDYIPPSGHGRGKP